MPDISSTPPKYSLPKVVSTIMSKGVGGAMDDPEQGPHVHLTLLLVAILVVSGLIIIATSLFI
jgi:hypothetical protein